MTAGEQLFPLFSLNTHVIVRHLLLWTIFLIVHPDIVFFHGIERLIQSVISPPYRTRIRQQCIHQLAVGAPLGGARVAHHEYELRRLVLDDNERFLNVRLHNHHDNQYEHHRNQSEQQPPL